MMGSACGYLHKSVVNNLVVHLNSQGFIKHRDGNSFIRLVKDLK